MDTTDLASTVKAITMTGSRPEINVGHTTDTGEGNLPPLPDLTGLDFSQMDAVRHTLSSRLAIVQGPPGTGKTFTSISVLKVLLSLATVDPCKHPIVIATQTNHSLDQLLRLLHGATKTEFVRLGQRSKNDIISSHTMFHLRKKSQKNFRGAAPGRIYTQRKTNEAAMQELIAECFPGDLLKPCDLLAGEIITQAQYDSLSGDGDESPFFSWLGDAIEPCVTRRFTPTTEEWEEADDPEAQDDRGITIDDDEGDRMIGISMPIVERWTGRVKPQMLRPALWKRAQLMLDRYQDLYKVPREYRGAVYRHLRNHYIRSRTDDFRALLKKDEKLTTAKKFCRNQLDAEVIKELKIPIVGCTTTGLTKYRKLIEHLEPRVLLIEEAAETREVNITSALFPSLEQLILVGDHMQLVPHTDLIELSCHPYNFRLSLFERMVKLEMKHAVLSVQRRMVPGIRRILKPFYPSLRDHESVLDKSMAPVPGMGDVYSYFFCHNWPERRTAYSSRINVNEAQMIVGFMRYLVQNGTPATKITVLTFYRGQRGLIYQRLEADPVLSNFNPLKRYNVCTVDGYQGEENDVVILSLVRCPSNKQYQVGFLDNQNRVVVALSRARRGLYIFGSYHNLLRASKKARKIWKPCIDVISKKDRCHSALQLTCKRHGTVVEVRTPQDLDVLHGGCKRECTARLDCGHVCQLRCHP